MPPLNKKLDNADIFQLLWGCALLLMGLAFFFRIPEVMRSFSEYDHHFGAWYVRLSLYFVAVILIGGGGKKIHRILYNAPRPPASSPDSE